MSDTIWKFTLEPVDRQTVSMPRGAQVLSVAEQNGQICMWARVNPDWENQDFTIVIAGTGHEWPSDTEDQYWSFIGTILMLHGSLVLHVFVLSDFFSEIPQ